MEQKTAFAERKDGLVNMKKGSIKIA